MNNKTGSRRAGILFAVALSLSPFMALAGHGDFELGGRPFSDPARVVPMPDSWRQQSIRRDTGQAADLALALDQQLYPAVLPLVQKFAKERNVKVAVQEGTCGLAANALVEKTADITGMCCPPGDLDRLPGVRYHTLGIAAIALIVHPSNPVEAVDLASARRLFGGNIKRWSDLPPSGIKTADDREVRPVARLHCAVRPGHWRLILDNADQFSHDVFEVPAITDMIVEVSQNPTAIGYETLWHVRDHASRAKVKTLRLNGHAPTDNDALATGKYPLYRVFSITTWSEGPAASVLADELGHYLVDHADAIDPVFGFVPISRLRRAGWKFLGDELVGEPR
jgi:ABC-type phosphate transport system substrate-binding protein